MWRGTGSGGAECVAQTADYGLVRAVISGLHLNYLLEDDKHDCIFDPEFVRAAPAAAAGLARQIRQAACRGWPAEVNEEVSEVSKTEAQGE